MRVSGSPEPFVGRTAELDALAGAYVRARGGRPGVVCVEGPAGIGKTALVRAFLATVPSLVLWASGDEDEMTLPWGVLAQLARGAQADRPEALRKLAELSPGADPLTSGQLLLDALGALTPGEPMVLVVEDLHWTDLPSAKALRFVLRRLSQEHVLAVVTTRPEEPAQIDDGWRRLIDDHGERMRLTGLGPPEIAQLALSLGAGILPGPAARRLWLHTGGNPLYTRCLIEEFGPAVLAAATGPLPAPRSLATLLVARLAACAPATQGLVSAPGPELALGHATMMFNYKDSFASANALEGYERLILLAMIGDQSLFTRSDGIERLWEISAQLLDNPPPVEPYARGSWGPKSVSKLIAPYGWHLPKR